jgi:hypothetical protein
MFTAVRGWLSPHVSQSITQKEYEEYEKANGDYAIASLFFLNELREIIRRERPGRILEVGVGVGTIPYAVREFQDTLEYVGTEAFEPCIERLGVHAPFVVHARCVRETEGWFDLIIVDGRDEDTHTLPERLRESGVILVENDRRDQVALIREAARRRRFVSFRKRPFSLDKAAGYTIFLFEPTAVDYVRFVTGWAWYQFKTHLQFQLNKARRVFKRRTRGP